MQTTAEVLAEIIRLEGEIYTNHPLDRGGPTKYGITLKTLERWRKTPCTAVDVQNLTRLEAEAIYRELYLKEPNFHLIEAVSMPVAAKLMDCGVNMGPGIPSRFLQRILNGFATPPTAPLVVDGAVGPATARALQAFLNHRGKYGTRVILVMLNSLQAVRYLEIVEKDATQKAFLFGWVNQRVGMPS